VGAFGGGATTTGFFKFNTRRTGAFLGCSATTGAVSIVAFISIALILVLMTYSLWGSAIQFFTTKYNSETLCFVMKSYKDIVKYNSETLCPPSSKN
jgi:hypothetical protein